MHRWVKRFMMYHGKRHPRDPGGAEVEAFLVHLPLKGKVSAPTQTLAKSAILFLCRDVFDAVVSAICVNPKGVDQSRE